MNGKRQECLIFSRVVGWMTPVANWNPAKKSEWEQRQEYKIENND